MSELLPRCTHVFGYCNKHHPPKGELTERLDKGKNFHSTPKCKQDWRICPDYRIAVMTMQPLPQSSPAIEDTAPVTTEP